MKMMHVRVESKRASTAGTPVVLLLAASEWISTARLAMALAGPCCRVHLAGKRSHPALSTSSVDKTFRYDPLRPLRSLRAAIKESGAVSLVAVDEVMVGHLEELWNAEKPGSPLRELIERSTGGPRAMKAASSRLMLLRAATAEGVRVPQTLPLSSERDVKQAANRLGLPLVLKSDASSGGRGVRVAEDLAGARGAWHTLHHAPGLVRAVKRGLIGKEWTHVRQWARKEIRGVTAQEWMSGGERTAMAVCRDGEVLALVCMDVVETWKQRGPSSVVRVIENKSMSNAVSSVVRSLKISGFCGFDFMVESETGEALLIEMNPRPTQLAHLPLGSGRDLAAAYLRAFAGVDVQDRQAATEGDLVALFPQEMQRDAASAWLQHAFHDVPWDEPALMRRAMTNLPSAILRDARWAGDVAKAGWPGDAGTEHEFAR